MTEPITAPELLPLRTAIGRVQRGTPVRGDKLLVLRQAPALLAALDQLHGEREAASDRLAAIVNERDDLRDEVKRLRAELAAGMSSQHGAELLAEVEKLRRELAEYRASDRRLRDLAQAALDEKNAARADAANRLAEARKDARSRVLDVAQTRVHRAFFDADLDGRDLNAMTVAELTAFVMTAIHGEDADG